RRSPRARGGSGSHRAGGDEPREIERRPHGTSASPSSLAARYASATATTRARASVSWMLRSGARRSGRGGLATLPSLPGGALRAGIIGRDAGVRKESPPAAARDRGARDQVSAQAPVPPPTTAEPLGTPDASARYAAANPGASTTGITSAVSRSTCIVSSRVPRAS